MLLTSCAEKCRGEVLLLTCCAEICNLLVQLVAEIFDFATRCLATIVTCVLLIFVCGDQDSKVTAIVHLGARPQSVNFSGDFAEIFLLSSQARKFRVEGWICRLVAGQSC